MPSVAVIVSEYVPNGVLVEVEIVSEVVPDAVRLGGLNTAVAEGGKPATLKFTLPAKPLLTVRETV